MAILNSEDQHDLSLDVALGRAKERVVSGRGKRGVVDV
jgi:hypothetical protein